MKAQNLKILIGCEFSGRVRDAFNKLGFNAISCDLLPSESPLGYHIQTDLIQLLKSDWDVVIAFPPCQFLSSAGLYLCNIENYGSRAIERIKKRNKALEFFLDIYNCNARHIAIENPVGFVSHSILKESQIIHPYYFGESEYKRTALWLKNLPHLIHSPVPTLFDEISYSKKPEPYHIQKSGKKRYITDHAGGQKRRSLISNAIASAMAEQWGNYLKNFYEIKT